MNSFDLQRFVVAQDPVYETVLSELLAGQKLSHWMWFIFPQLRGLGESSMSYEFGIEGIDEAMAYLEHAVLGIRLRECTRLVNEINRRSVQQIFGYPDYLKFWSCMTLFDEVAADDTVFQAALSKYFDRDGDPGTLELLAAAQR